MPTVRVKDNEAIDVALRRFRRACDRAGVYSELRRISFYEKPTEQRKRERSSAVVRARKRSNQSR